MSLPGDPATPRQFPIDMPGLSSVPEKDSYEGLTVYSLGDKAGPHGLLAPDLNFLKVFERDKTGETTEYIDIRREAPPDELFRPPDGVVVDRVTSFKELSRHSSMRPPPK
jgi:hypothetical protein